MSSDALEGTWRSKGIAVVGIVFGVIWLVDAWFKWQPDFINKFTDYLSETLKDQPAAVQARLHF